MSTATATETTTTPSFTIIEEDEKVIPTDHPSLVLEQQQQQYHPYITPITSSDQLEHGCIMPKGTDNTESSAPSQSIVGSGQLEEGQMMMQGTESLSNEKKHSLPVFSLFLSKSKRGSAPIEYGTVIDQMVDVYVDVDVDVCRLEVAVSDDTVKAPFPPKRLAVSDNSIGMTVAVAAAIEVIDVTDESKDALEEPEEQCDDNDDDANGESGFGTVKENVDDDEEDDDDVRGGSGVRRSKRIRSNASAAAAATTVHARYSVDNHHVTPDCTACSSSSSSSSSSLPRRASRRMDSDSRGNSSGKPSNTKANLFFLTKVGDTAVTITITINCCFEHLDTPPLSAATRDACMDNRPIYLSIFFIGTAERACFEAEGGGGSSRRRAAETAAGDGSQGEGGAHPQRHRPQQTGDDLDADQGECC